MTEKSEGSGAPPLAPQTEDVASKMLAVMQAVLKHLDEFAYLENLRAKALTKELAAEAAAAERREAARVRWERLTLAANVLNGMLANGGWPTERPDEIVRLSFVYADALLAAAESCEPRAAPSEAAVETREGEDGDT